MRCPRTCNSSRSTACEQRGDSGVSVLDMGVTLLTLSLAVVLRPKLPQMSFLIPLPGINPPWIYVLIPILWVLVFLATSVYDPKRIYKLVDELQAVFLGSLLAALLCAGLFFLTFREFSRWLFITFLVMNIKIKRLDHPFPQPCLSCSFY